MLKIFKRKNNICQFISLMLLFMFLSGGIAQSQTMSIAGNETDFHNAFKLKTNVDIQLPNCPDANGILQGKGSLKTAETVTEFEITGYVTDAAELSHFDIKGTTTEILSGGGRSGRVNFTVEGNKIGVSGKTQSEDDKIGKTTFSEPTAEMNGQMSKLLTEAAQAAVKAIFEKSAAEFRAARNEWRGGACVEVKLSAAKTKLMPGEKIAVTAESFHKQEKTAFNASLNVKSATANAAPNTQTGTPQAIFTLTAPPRGTNASITVESVSKRGIGSAKSEFLQDATVGKVPTKPVKINPPIIDPKKPPTKKPTKTPIKCKLADNWKGTISLATSGKRDTPTGQTGARGGRLQDAVSYKETIYKIDYQIYGEKDNSGKFANAFFAEANVSYLTKYYRSFVYAPAYCGTTRIPQEKKELLNKSEARGDGRVTIFISAYEKNGSFQLFAPNAVGESIYEQVYFSNCPKNDGANTFKRNDGKFEWQFKGLLVEFENENSESGILIGTKTFANSDGTETTVSWNLKSDCV